MDTKDRIKNRRLELGLSVEKLAEKLGKNKATVYRYEKGDIENVPITIIESLAKALYTTPAYLMGWGDDPIDYTITTNEESMDEKINKKVLQLDEKNKQDVYDFVEMKLNKQKQSKISELPKKEIYNSTYDPTIVRAAHLDREGITKEEMGEVHEFFKYADEYADNRRKNKK